MDVPRGSKIALSSTAVLRQGVLVALGGEASVSKHFDLDRDTDWQVGSETPACLLVVSVEIVVAKCKRSV